jgi:asparagine synthase (glutamine-hydrolysing)
MCGFVTIYSPNTILFEPKVLGAMTNEIVHRGPDDYGYAIVGPDRQVMWHDDTPAPFVTSGVAMGHRRLSILDLSEAGRQPFVSKNHRYWMVYNGEVYNYVELRDELRALGHSFVTSTDTEVVLAAYQQWGRDFLRRLNGMWAIVIWDKKNNTLLASRDRFGIKPLYYCRVGSQWIFASEIKSLLKYPGFKARQKDEAVFHFLWSEQQPGIDQTYFHDILSLPAASYLQVKDGKDRCEKFWRLPEYESLGNGKLAEKTEQFVELLKDSVRLRLRSDVRIGTMLSGGLDSTSIVKIINDLLGEQVAETSSINGIQQAISACYPNMWNDETERIDHLAAQLKINVKKIYPVEENVRDQFFSVIRAMEMPYTQSSPHVQYMLMHHAHSLGIKVTLNGHGPDEMFGGYPLRHCSLLAVEQFVNLQLKSWFKTMVNIKKMHNIGITAFVYDLLLFVLPTVGKLAREVYRLPKRKYFHRNYFSKYPVKYSRLFDRETGGKSILDCRLRQEFFSEVLPPILTYEDKMSMAASVESRVPFLDYRIVEFAFSLSDADRIHYGITKYIMREAMKDSLPPSIVNEKMKLYFNGPIDKWLKGQLRPIVAESLMQGDCLIDEYMNPKQFRPLIKRVLDNDEYEDWDERLIWRMLIAESWLREFIG